MRASQRSQPATRSRGTSHRLPGSHPPRIHHISANHCWPGTCENYIPGISQGLTGLQAEQNLSWVALPSVPSQSPHFFVDPTNSSVSATSSTWSQEYGSALVGCVLSASLSTWVTAGGAVYQGGDLPASLSTNGANLPFTSATQYGVGQEQPLTYQLSAPRLTEEDLRIHADASVALCHALAGHLIPLASFHSPLTHAQPISLSAQFSLRLRVALRG